jgi:hypothetical protein
MHEKKEKHNKTFIHKKYEYNNDIDPLKKMLQEKLHD